MHDVLITNPPYSADHKERVLAYCARTSKPWLLLMPNYVANKQYFRGSGACLSDSTCTIWVHDRTDYSASIQLSTEFIVIGFDPVADGVFFVVPRDKYEYEHPEGTGHVRRLLAAAVAQLWLCVRTRIFVQVGVRCPSVFGVIFIRTALVILWWAVWPLGFSSVAPPTDNTTTGDVAVLLDLVLLVPPTTHRGRRGSWCGISRLLAPPLLAPLRAAGGDPQ